MAARGPVARRRQRRWFGRLVSSMGLAALLVACGGDPVPRGVPDSSLPDALPGTPAEVEKALLTTDEPGRGGSTSVRCPRAPTAGGCARREALKEPRS